MITKKNQSAFTLLEILVAIFILAIIAVIMVRGLQIVITTKDNLQRNQGQMQQLNLTMSFLSGDIHNLINRSYRLANGALQLPIMLHDDAGDTFEFIRGGLVNPMQQRQSNLQHAAYRLSKGRLIRLSWPVVDQAKVIKPEQRVLLKHITFLKWQFLGNDNRLYSGWPASGANYQLLPKAVKVTITIAKLGTIQRLFLVDNKIPQQRPVMVNGS